MCVAYHDSTEHAEQEGGYGRHAGGEEVRVPVDGDVVVVHAALEEEVLRQGDALVDGEPVTLQVTS